MQKSEDKTTENVYEEMTTENGAEDMHELITTEKDTEVTASMFGRESFKTSSPEHYENFVRKYMEILDLAISARTYKIDVNISEQLSNIADVIGSLRGGPRDITDIHTEAFKRKISGQTILKARAYAKEANYLSLELMGRLVLYYRNQSLGYYSESQDTRSKKNNV